MAKLGALAMVKDLGCLSENKSFFAMLLDLKEGTELNFHLHL